MSTQTLQDERDIVAALHHLASIDTWTRTDAGWRMRSRVFDVRITIGDIVVLQPG